MSPLGIKAFEVGVDRSIRPGDDHPTRFFSPCRRGDDCLEIVRCVEHLRSRHESGLLHREIGCKVLMELVWIEVREAICCLLYRTRLAEVTGKRFPSSASFSPASGMCAATYTNPTTDGS